MSQLHYRSHIMKLILDVREAALYNKAYLINEAYSNSNVEIETKSLHLGDALIESEEGKPVWIIERKSLNDLLASLRDGRYEEQSYRLQNDADHPRHNVVYIIEGMYSQLAKPEHKRVILSTIASLSYFKGFSVFRTCSVQETAELLVYIADKIDRKFQKGFYHMSIDGTLIVQKSVESVSLSLPKKNRNYLQKKYNHIVQWLKR